MKKKSKLGFFFLLYQRKPTDSIFKIVPQINGGRINIIGLTKIYDYIYVHEVQASLLILPYIQMGI